MYKSEDKIPTGNETFLIAYGFNYDKCSLDSAVGFIAWDLGRMGAELWSSFRQDQNVFLLCSFLSVPMLLSKRHRRKTAEVVS